MKRSSNQLTSEGRLLLHLRKLVTISHIQGPRLLATKRRLKLPSLERSQVRSSERETAHFPTMSGRRLTQVEGARRTLC